MCVCQLPEELKEHTKVERGRESVAAFSSMHTSEMHPTQLEKQLLDHEGIKRTPVCESLKTHNLFSCYLLI